MSGLGRIGLIIVVLLAPAAQSTRNLHEDAWGRGSSLIRLDLVQEESGRKYQAVVSNSSAQPVFIVLGTIVGNDKELCPGRVELLLTGVDGKTRASHCELGVVGGRLDPMIVPLSVGAAYSLPIADLKGYRPGHYVLKAKYTGIAVPLRAANSDMQGLSLIHYWTGTVESRSVAVDLH